MEFEIFLDPLENAEIEDSCESIPTLIPQTAFSFLQHQVVVINKKNLSYFLHFKIQKHGCPAERQMTFLTLRPALAVLA